LWGNCVTLRLDKKCARWDEPGASQLMPLSSETGSVAVLRIANRIAMRAAISRLGNRRCPGGYLLYGWHLGQRRRPHEHRGRDKQRTHGRANGCERVRPIVEICDAVRVSVRVPFQPRGDGFGFGPGIKHPKLAVVLKPRLPRAGYATSHATHNAVRHFH